MVRRYDRTGEPVEVPLDFTPTPRHDSRCRAGWLPDDDQGRPVPCLACRPHLAATRSLLSRLTEGPRP